MMAKKEDKAFQAFCLLRFAFVLLPLLAGFDKFFNVLANWHYYLAPFIVRYLNGHERYFMEAVGIIEMAVGVGIILKPRIFSYVIAIWLLCIIINLLPLGYFDVALRDLGLLLSALALGRLSQKYTK